MTKKKPGCEEGEERPPFALHRGAGGENLPAHRQTYLQRRRIDGTKYRLFAMMIRYGVSKDDALDVCERPPETLIEFLAERGPISVRRASNSAISEKEAA